MSAFDDYFAKMMPDALRGLDDFRPEGLVNEPGITIVPVDGPLTARKMFAYMDVPDELLMDAGLIPDTRPPRPPLPWRWRIRNKVSGWREQAARRAYRIIAGYWPVDGEDNW